MESHQTEFAKFAAVAEEVKLHLISAVEPPLMGLGEDYSEFEEELENDKCFVDFSNPDNRTFRAKKNIHKGDLLVKSKPIYKLPHDNSRKEVCNYCLNWSTNLKECSKCKFFRYCSITCQRNDWKEHKPECNPALHQMSNNFIISTRLLRKRMSTDPEFIKDYRKTLLMRANLSDLAIQEEKKCDDLLMMSYQMHKTIKCPVDKRSLLEGLHVICAINSNSYCILDENIELVGSGLYFPGNFANHSCKPNAFVVYDQDKSQIIKAKCDIKQGEEIFVSYVDEGSSYLERSQKIKNDYYFKCQCSRCLDESTLPIDKKEAYRCPKCNEGIFSGGMQICDKCGHEVSKLEYKEICEKIDNANKLVALTRELEGRDKVEVSIQKYKRVLQAYELHLSEYHFAKKPLLEKLSFLSIEMKDFSNAYIYSRKLVELCSVLYPEDSELLAMFKYKLGKLASVIGKIKEAVDNLRQAAAVLEISHEHHKKFVYELKENLASNESLLAQM